MGPNYTLVKFCSRIFFILALSHGAILKSEGHREEDLALSPDDVCPCIVRADCPRQFGAKPEDKLLGYIPACIDPELVRCCGVSIESTISSSVRKSDGKKTGTKTVVSPDLTPDIVVPVPLQFSTNFETRSSTVSPKYEDDGDSYYDYYDNDSEEAITDIHKDQTEDEEKIYYESSTVKIPYEKSNEGELNSLKILKGENIDGIISQTDAFLSPDYLDYRGVNKCNVKGGVQTITGSEQRGEIFSTKRVESDKKSDIIVNDEDSYNDHGRTTETMHELSQKDEDKLFEQSEFLKHKIVSSESTDSRTSINDEQKDDVSRKNSHSQNQIIYEKSNSAEVDYLIEKNEPVISRSTHRLMDNERINNSKSGSRRKTGYKIHQQTSHQQESEKVNSELLKNFEDNSSSSVVVQGNEQQEDVETIGQTTVKSRIPIATIRELESAINSRGKTEHKNRTLVSNQQRSQSVTTESMNVEEQSLSNDDTVAKNTEEQSNSGIITNFSGRRRRPVSTLQKVTSNSGTETRLGSRSRATWGYRKEISSQQQSEFLKRKHSNIDENASDVQSTTTNTGDQLDHDLTTEIPVTTSRPLSELRRLALNRGRMFSTQRKRISSQQQNEPVKIEPTNFEQTTAASVQIVTSSTVELSHGETSSEKIRSGSIAESNHRQREEIISTHEIIETVAKGSSSLTESTSSNVNQAAITQESTSSVDSTATIIEANENQSRAINQETVSGSTDNVTVNVGQQTETSSNQQNEMVSDESVNSEKETVTSTLNLSNLVARKQSLEGEVISKLAETEKISNLNLDMNREEDRNALLVGNRTYVPVLINTVFLRDRAIADSRIASDPVSSMILSDVGKTELAPLLLLLRCGKVVFSEGFKNGKTLVCDVPKDEASIRFLKDNDIAVSSGKLDIIMADTAEPHRVADDDIKEAMISSNTKNHSVENSLKKNSLISESHSEESSTMTTAEVAENVRQIALANSVSTNSLASAGSHSEESSKVFKTVEAAKNDHQLSLESSMTTNSFASELQSEKSSPTTTTSTVEAAKNDRQISVGRRVRFRRPIQVPVPEERREKETEALPKPTRRTYRGRIRHRTFGRQGVPGAERIRHVEEDQAVVGSRQLMKESVSTFVQGSESSTNSNQEVIATAPDFDVFTTEEYDGVKETAVRNSRSYFPPPATILSHPQKDLPEAMEDRAMPESDRGESETPKILEAFAEAPASQIKISKKKTSDFSIEKKLSSKDLELAKIRTSENNAANVQARELVGPTENPETPSFVYNRNNRQIVKFAPEKEAVTISPEDLSMTGRINVVGLIPAGFKDPALTTEDELAIDVPKNTFRPSPVDPINWP